MAVSVVVYLRVAAVRPSYCGVVGRCINPTYALPDDEKVRAREAAMKGPFAFTFERLSRMLRSNPQQGGFFSGDQISVGDLKVYTFIMYMYAAVAIYRCDSAKCGSYACLPLRGARQAKWHADGHYRVVP
jgi:hypothetical protein